MKERNIIIVSKVLSVLFNPFYLPVVGILALFFFSYLMMLPLLYKIMIILLVLVFTVLLPGLLIRMYHRYEGWTFFDLYPKERRMIPYIISIACYFVCYYIMRMMHVPHFMGSIVVTALAIQVICAIVNHWWKISTHTAGIGGVGGALMAFGSLFNFNPVWWLCIVVLIGGAVGTSRMMMRQHTLSDVTGGFVIGMVTAFVTVLVV